jgi:hypothetical protein
MSLSNEAPVSPVYRKISADLQTQMNLVLQSEAVAADADSFAQIKELIQTIVNAPSALPSW